MSENSTDLVNYPDKSQAFLPAIPMIPGNRVNLLENRVSSQERTTAVLLDQAFRIKDDIVSYLQGSKGHQQGEATARQLLENHIQTITSIVKKLSHDIEVLEKQIRTRDNVATGTTFAVQSLDHKYLHGFGDLRGRVARASCCSLQRDCGSALMQRNRHEYPAQGRAPTVKMWCRCDASIAKLSGDINIIRHEIQRLEKEIGGIRSTSESYANSLEMKVMRLLDKIETSNSEQSSHLKTVQGDQHHELQLLDFKVNSLLNDLRDQIQDQQKWTEIQLRRSEQEQAYHKDQFLNAMKERLEAAEKKLEENLHLSLKLENNKPQQCEMALSQVTKYENKLHARITRFERQIWNELEEIQNEYRSGFQSIHEALNSLQRIQMTKLKLEKKKFQKDIKKIQCKVTELQEE
ncbi:protein FAM81B isoform X1 [Lepidochelys kempii]|uniref:protein FAM81B isoform X1 n=1 Tax=Lepidochelys kempii TaxID=8472 RepID=UPI003C6FBF8E